MSHHQKQIQISTDGETSELVYSKGQADLLSPAAAVELLDIHPLGNDFYLLNSRASLTVRITVKSGDPPGAGKIWENQFFTGKADSHGANCSQIGTYTCQGTRKSGQNFFHLHIHGRRSHFSGGHLWFFEECTKLVKLDFSSSGFIFVTTSISHIPPSLLLHSKALSVNACRIMVQKNVVLIKIWSDLLYFLSSSSSVGVLSAYTKLDMFRCSNI